MNVDFFDTPCKEPVRNDSLIGICDDNDDENQEKPAYTDIESADKWIAEIKNEGKISVSFTPIDNCIFVHKVGTKEKLQTCDGMLTFNKSLFLIELKDHGSGGWLNEAIPQLESTIKILLSNHDLKSLPYKKAFVCNKKRKRFSFNEFHNEENKRFFKEYGFRLDIQAEIVIS